MAEHLIEVSEPYVHWTPSKALWTVENGHARSVLILDVSRQASARTMLTLSGRDSFRSSNRQPSPSVTRSVSLGSDQACRLRLHLAKASSLSRLWPWKVANCILPNWPQCELMRGNSCFQALHCKFTRFATSDERTEVSSTI